MYAEGKLHGEVGGVVEPGRPLSKLDGENFEELECHVRNGARTLTCCCSSRLFEARSDRKTDLLWNVHSFPSQTSSNALGVCEAGL